MSMECIAFIVFLQGIPIIIIIILGKGGIGFCAFNGVTILKT